MALAERSHPYLKLASSGMKFAIVWNSKYQIINNFCFQVQRKLLCFLFFTSCHWYVTNIHYVLTVDSHGDFFEGATTNKLKINICYLVT